MAKRGGFPGGIPGNMNQLMKQAQRMQKKLEEQQKEMEEKLFEGTAGGNAVKIVLNGKREVQEVKIEPDVVDPEDVDMLQDLIAAALGEALRAIDENQASGMESLAGGFGGLGGLSF